MPLLDHFHPPLREERHWEGFHSKWANSIVDALNERLLPPGYFAEPHIHFGARVEIDAATFRRQALDDAASAPSALATAPVRTWAPPEPTLVFPAAFPDTFEVRVVNTDAGPVLVAAVELVSPGNKVRPDQRRAFALKCASYLVQGVGLIVVDVVTNRLANLHDEIVRLLPAAAALLFPAQPPLYAAAYRPIRREDRDEVDAWLTPLAVGEPLPVVPLSLTAELCLPIPLENTYTDACRKLRLA